MLDNIFTTFTSFDYIKIIMNTQYSILSAMIRPEIQEKISIGFLLMDEQNVYFSYSKHKLAVAKSLMSENAYKLLKDALHAIQHTAAMEQKGNIPTLGFDKHNSFAPKYIHYLSSYNNNILSFTPPKVIEVEATQEVFNTLYKKYIDSSITKEKLQFEHVLDGFIEEKRTILSKHFNIDKEITMHEIPALIVPVTVTFIGQNEVPTFVQSLELTRRPDHIAKEIADILFLQKAFSSKPHSCKAMAIVNEPDKNVYPKQHSIWQQLNNINDIQTFDISEAEAVIDYAERHNVLPFITT